MTSIPHKLESWFAEHQRNLPWRRPDRNSNRRGYHVFVAEIMLQQTQVDRVIDRYQQFIRRFPTVRSLADADTQEVLTLWQGLGYYRRAHYLHSAAQQIINEHKGRIPREVDALLTLPGIGPYTAGAVASIAFGQRVPIVDGSVARVLSRVYEIELPFDQTIGRNLTWKHATALVEKCTEPATFNQAMMELGSLICTPKDPKCDQCPIHRSCRAKRHKRTHELPMAQRKNETQPIYVAVLPLIRRNRIYLVQRPDHGLWASLWHPTAYESTQPIKLKDLAHHMSRSHNIEATQIVSDNHFIHHTSHRTVHFTIHSAIQTTGRARRGRWIHLNEMQNTPISNAHHKVIRMTIQEKKDR